MVTHPELLAILEELAPRACAAAGDAPGFEHRAKEESHRLGVCLDPTDRNLYLAAGEGIDFILTHHPWRQQAAAVVKANGISLYRLHSAWDLAPEGNLVTLARLLGLRDLVLEDGLLTGTAELGLRELIERCQRLLSADVIPFCGDLASRAGTVGLLPGSGFWPIFHQRWQALADLGCDTLISGEISHTAMRFAQTRGLRLIDLGHNGLARPGLIHLASLLRTRLSGFGCQVDFLEDGYAVNYYTAWSASAGETKDLPSSGGVVLPFSR